MRRDLFTSTQAVIYVFASQWIPEQHNTQADDVGVQMAFTRWRISSTPICRNRSRGMIRNAERERLSYSLWLPIRVLPSDFSSTHSKASQPRLLALPHQFLTHSAVF
ncbi:hypothetical protein NPIL_674051 [Nephila pilipes]|uniref:Uncharacterized protein n=1 Tax=Nephila pilipes TaxID=299642 RepID=A0A8X6UHY4_NEPPI|nr:hypothetical protein NPIL_674051 [Nephila pilipes]